MGQDGDFRVWAVFVTASFRCCDLETSRPRRELIGRPKNVGVVALLVVSGFSLKAVLWITPIAAAIAVAASPYGLLNATWAASWLTFPVAIVLLDLSRYLVHRAFHHSTGSGASMKSITPIPITMCRLAEDFILLNLVVQASYLTAILLLAPPVAAVFAAERSLSRQLLCAWQRVTSDWSTEIRCGYSSRPIFIAFTIRKTFPSSRETSDRHSRGGTAGSERTRRGLTPARTGFLQE